MITIASVVQVLERVANPSYQESYDNSGLIIGNPGDEVRGIIVCLDSIESVIDEAIAGNCNLVVAHHPIIFTGIKKINGSNYIERVIIKAIRNNIAIYAIHTNLDNVINGVNQKICDKLGLINARILKMKSGRLLKLVTFVPTKQSDSVREALFAAGAGNIGNYSECSFIQEGLGTFKGGKGSNPSIGKKGIQEQVKEDRIEVLLNDHRQSAVLKALFETHPYEEVAYDLYPVLNHSQDVGSGMIAELPEEMSEVDFLRHVRNTMKCASIRHTELLGKPVKKVAICGGSGSFLLDEAKNAGAQTFISADFKYHQFFDADRKIVIADIGHFESEQFTIDLIRDILVENFPNFGVHLTQISTNPIKYL